VEEDPAPRLKFMPQTYGSNRGFVFGTGFRRWLDFLDMSPFYVTPF
jgi:hypothetical protein